MYIYFLVLNVELLEIQAIVILRTFTEFFGGYNASSQEPCALFEEGRNVHKINNINK